MNTKENPFFFAKHPRVACNFARERGASENDGRVKSRVPLLGQKTKDLSLLRFRETIEIVDKDKVLPPIALFQRDNFHPLCDSQIDRLENDDFRMVFLGKFRNRECFSDARVAAEEDNACSGAAKSNFLLEHFEGQLRGERSVNDSWSYDSRRRRCVSHRGSLFVGICRLFVFFLHCEWTLQTSLHAQHQVARSKKMKRSMVDFDYQIENNGEATWSWLIRVKELGISDLPESVFFDTSYLEVMHAICGPGSQIIPWENINATPQSAKIAERLVFNEAMELSHKTHPMDTLRELGDDDDDVVDIVITFSMHGNVVSSLVGENLHPVNDHVVLNSKSKKFDIDTQKRIVNVFDYLKARRLRLERPRDRGAFFDKIVAMVYAAAMERIEGFRKVCAMLVIQGGITCVPRPNGKPRLCEKFVERCAERAWNPGGPIARRLSEELELACKP